MGVGSPVEGRDILELARPARFRHGRALPIPACWESVGWAGSAFWAPQVAGW